jgi:hypothetical protein
MVLQPQNAQDPNAKAGKFGFAVDNTIGATPQPNEWMDDWVEFYRERRLRHQLDLLGTRLTGRVHIAGRAQAAMKHSRVASHARVRAGNLACSHKRPRQKPPVRTTLRCPAPRPGDARMKALAQPVLDNLGFWFTDIAGSIRPSILHGDL